MERHEAEFVEMCADWGELKGVVVRISRTEQQYWQVRLAFTDIYGSFTSPPVIATNDQRKGDTPMARRSRLFEKLNHAAAHARSQRTAQICRRQPAAAKVRP